MDPTQPTPGTPAPAPPGAECCPRRSFMLGGLIGGAAGLLGGAGGVAATKAPGWSWSPKPPDPVLNDLPEGAKLSYAQFGEDLVASSLFYLIDMQKPTYLDIGAYDPIRSNNTYLFYLRGAKGVVVEPNPAFSDKTRQVRSRDTLLVAGIGIDDSPAMDYYMFESDELNTFDKDQVDRLVRDHGLKILRVVKMPMISINRAIEENFGGACPDYISIDIEGLDFAVLNTLNFEKYRPKIICAETLITATKNHNPKTTALLVSKGYEVRGMTFPNTFYVDKRLLG